MAEKSSILDVTLINLNNVDIYARKVEVDTLLVLTAVRNTCHAGSWNPLSDMLHQATT